MYVQMCVKGIAGGAASSRHTLTWSEARHMVESNGGILSNWWRAKGQITPPEVADILNETNLNRHLHDYAAFRDNTPFISLAGGAVERDRVAQTNFVYSAIDTALLFATDGWLRPGALFFCWVPTALNKAVELSAIAEPVRDLLTYRRWSPFQLEGELAAKVHVPANQIERVEWWDGAQRKDMPLKVFNNPNYVCPAAVTNLRDLF
jgi:hypothetical protein